MGARERFLKIYADLPLEMRKEIIVIIGKEPLSWNAAYVEVFNNTKHASEILKKLEQMKII